MTSPESSCASDALPRRDCSAPDFKFGDPVEARTFNSAPWMPGFYFIAYIPEMDCPYIVKGDLRGSSCSYPFRAHKEVRHVKQNK